MTQHPKLKVLVVDDHRDSSQVLRLMLERRGYDVQCAETGAEALRIAGELDPDIAIVDVCLPDADGIELGARLREQSGYRALQVLTISGYVKIRERAAIAPPGSPTHFNKPLDFEQLFAALRAP